MWKARTTITTAKRCEACGCLLLEPRDVISLSLSLSLSHTHPTYFIFFLPLLIIPFLPPKDSSVERGFYLESQHFRIPLNTWISPTFIQALTQEPSFFSLKDSSVLLITEQATSLYISQGGTPLSQSSHCGWRVFMRSIYWSYEKMIWH